MSILRRGLSLMGGIVFAGIAMGQSPAGSPVILSASTFVPLTKIQVPEDPLEPVNSGAVVAQSPEERAAALDLIEKAHQLSNIRRHPYDLKTALTSYGSSSYDGHWILEDTSPSGEIYRWSAEGPSFSGIFLTVDKLLSSNRPGGAMPLRLAQVRDVMWGAYSSPIGPYATVRTANGNLPGGQVRCVLIRRMFFSNKPPEFSSGRSFDESEYCVNIQTGLLETYSPCGGVYVRFDYANAFHFHEQIIPDGFVITEQGKTVVEAKTESVSEPAPKTSSLFTPAGLTPLGAGLAVNGPMLSRDFLNSPGAAGQVVVVHAMASPDGKMTETEILASTNPALNQAALDSANRRRLLFGPQRQPGASATFTEVIFTVEFGEPPQFAPRGLSPSGLAPSTGPVRPIQPPDAPPSQSRPSPE